MQEDNECHKYIVNDQLWQSPKGRYTYEKRYQ